MGPIFEKPPLGRRIGEIVKKSAVVNPEAREERQIVSTRKHVHRIDLQESEPVNDLGEGGGARRRSRPMRAWQQLRVEREAAGLVTRQGRAHLRDFSMSSNRSAKPALR